MRSCPWVAPGLALIFDMDGVMVHSNPVHCRAWQIYNSRFGIQTDEDMLQRMYGKHNDDIVRDYFGTRLSRDEIAAHGAAKERLYREIMAPSLENSLVPGLREFLSRHASVPMAVATNAEPANVDFILDAANLRRYFRVVVNGQMVSRPKPYPDVFLCAAAELRIAPAACIVFEDSLSGVEASRAAGMRTVGVLTTHRELPGLDLAIDHFFSPELEPWLQSQTLPD
ncbi:MAG TPA: beta-phosphoglucomutase family hydrolase [Bryobacteraceae bacterium]|nr:beta-phosphoglucomutase family hydrolase [Bryobacteraceae bacterium]